jgi:AcrR family transcriptional regulator
MPVPTPNEDVSSATATRERILDTAEKHFAMHGFNGTSLRALTEEAGVNLAAVNYHFGSKEALYEHVFVRRVAPMNTRRLAVLKEAQKSAGDLPVPLPRLLDLMLRPIVELAASTRPDPHPFPRVMLRSFIEPQPFMRPVLAREFGPLFLKLVPALRAATPWLDLPTLGFRLRLVLTAAVINYATVPFLPSNPMFEAAQPLFARPPEEQLAHLIAFIEAGLRAPLPGASPII